MKKFVLITTLALFFIARIQAQNGERLQALKIAWLTQKLDLTPEEAQRFWPVYNKYTSEIKAVRQEGAEKNSTVIEVEDKVLAVRKKYNGEFLKVLSPEKVNTFFRLEVDFNKIVQRELQERRMDRKKGMR